MTAGETAFRRRGMKLKNFLIAVTDMELSKRFYRELFGLRVAADFGENVILTEGLVLQERTVWQSSLGKKVSRGGCDAELYFEESCLDDFLRRVEDSGFSVEYLNPLTERGWGQRFVRLCDPDLHVIEIAESPESVVRRFLSSGMSIPQTAERTGMLLSQVEDVHKSMSSGHLN